MEKYKDCPLIKINRIFGKPWRFVVIDRLLSGPKTYNELLWSLSGISAKTLSKILKEFIHLNIVEIKYEIKNKKRYYALTNKGKDFEKIIKQIRIWVEKWL